MTKLRSHTIVAGWGGIGFGLALAGLVTEHCGEKGLWAGTPWGVFVDGAVMLVGAAIIFAAGRES